MKDNGQIKLHRRLRGHRHDAISDTVEERRKAIGFPDSGKDVQLLEKARRLWENMDGFRRQAKRALRYIYGDQWSELITVNGRTMTQRRYLTETGNIALQSNQLKKKLNTTVGTLLREEYEPSIQARSKDEQQFAKIMHELVRANYGKDEFFSVLIQLVKDAAALGLGVAHESYEAIDGLEDTRTGYVDPSYFFCDSGFTDPRFRDISMIGQFFDCDWAELVMRFAHSDSDYEALRDIYPEPSQPLSLSDDCDSEERHDPGLVDFGAPYDRSRCRVYEVWTKEVRKRHHLYDYNTGEDWCVDDGDKPALRSVRDTNAMRRRVAPADWGGDIPLIEDDTFFETFWHGRFLAPDGTVLWEGDSPYGDGAHPFVLLVPSSEGGIIQSYMTDGIDHQILINRAIILDDWLTRTQAKGVTFMPRSLVKGHEKEIASSWASMADLIYINDPEPGSETRPFTVNGQSTHYEAANLITIYKGLLEDSVTAGGAIAGDTPMSGTSASLYAQQTSNSATPMLEFIKNVRNFVVSVMKKKLKNILSFYTVERIRAVVGDADSLIDNSNLDLNSIASIEYDLEVRESPTSPAYKLIRQQRFDNLLAMGAITSDEYFMFSGVDEGEEIMQRRQAQQAEMRSAEPQLPQGLPSAQ